MVPFWLLPSFFPSQPKALSIPPHCYYSIGDALTLEDGGRGERKKRRFFFFFPFFRQMDVTKLHPPLLSLLAPLSAAAERVLER